MKTAKVIINDSGYPLTFRQVKEWIHDILRYNPEVIERVIEHLMKLNEKMLKNFIKYLIVYNKGEANKLFYLDSKYFAEWEENKIINVLTFIFKNQKL